VSRRLAALCFLVLALSGFSPGSHRRPATFGGSQVVTGTSCTVAFDSSSTPTLATVNTAINAAIDGQVVCLARGSVWSAATGITITASHPNSNRVQVCASTGAVCSDSGAANPRISLTGTGGTGISFTAGSGAGGYYFKNLDLYQTNAANNATGVGIGSGMHDITFEGSVIDTFWRAVNTNEETNFPDNVTFGLCGGAGHWIEIRNGPTTIGDRAAIYGGMTNSHISVWIHDFSAGGTGHFATSHYIDMGAGRNTQWFNSQHDLTIECSLIQFDASHSNNISATETKINRGFHITIRDNTFEVLNGSGGPNAVAYADHGDSGNAGSSEGVSGSGATGAGSQFYRNIVRGQNALQASEIADLDVFDNVFDFTNAGGTSTGIIRYHYGDGATDDVPIADIRIFNNTIFKGSTTPAMFGSISDNPTPPPNRPLPTDLQLFNNLWYEATDNLADDTNGNADIGVNIFTQNCARYGTNGTNIHDNYVYSPNDTTPTVWSGCSAAARNSNQSPHAAGFNINPLLVNVGVSDLHLLSSSSPPYKFSNGVLGPAFDYDQHAQTSPNTAGAFANIQ
jgi:hypothetical protein